MLYDQLLEVDLGKGGTEIWREKEAFVINCGIQAGTKLKAFPICAIG